VINKIYIHHLYSQKKANTFTIQCLEKHQHPYMVVVVDGHACCPVPAPASGGEWISSIDMEILGRQFGVPEFAPGVLFIALL
jgi:hypothetical protein